jgi:hypothetical protein
MTYHHEGATGSYTLTGRDAALALARTVIREVWKRNWPLVIDYGIATLGSIVVQYFFLDGWPLLSLALSIFVAAITFLIGLFMAWTVITITITITKTIR